MLPPFIIEQIRRREEEERRRREEQHRPRLDLPIDVYPAPEPSKEEQEHERGIVILDLG